MEVSLFNVESGYKNDLSRRKMGIFLKSLRKLKKMTQTEMATIIRCAQGSVSKYEEGVMELSAIEMIRICESLSIKPEAFSRCYTDSKKVANQLIRTENEPFKIPKRYKENCVYNIRGVNPLIEFGKQELGEEKFNQAILSELKIEPSYLCLMDGQINGNFVMDLGKLIKFDQDRFFEFFPTFFKSFSNHGEVHSEFINSKSALGAIRHYIHYSGLYDMVYERKISLDTHSKLMITYKIKKEDTMEKLIDGYQAKFLEQMATYCATFNEDVRIIKNTINYETFSFEAVLC